MRFIINLMTIKIKDHNNFQNKYKIRFLIPIGKNIIRIIIKINKKQINVIKIKDIKFRELKVKVAAI